MRQIERLEAFDQKHLNIHGSNWLWKSSAAPRQIFKKHKPKPSEWSISEMCHHSAEGLCPCALTLHILAHFEDLSSHNPRLWEQSPFWRMRVQSGPWYWNGRDYKIVQKGQGSAAASVLCCNRQLAFDYSHTAKDRLPFLQTSRHFRRLYSHFFAFVNTIPNIFS